MQEKHHNTREKAQKLYKEKIKIRDSILTDFALGKKLKR